MNRFLFWNPTIRVIISLISVECSLVNINLLIFACEIKCWMEDVYLLLGGNLGERSHYISMARELISKQVGTVLAESALYETAPWGSDHSPLFLNCVLKIQTLLEPFSLLKQLLQIELQLGRIRTGEVNASRTIDIDILFYGDRIISAENLQIPHPRMHLRRFVLIPLNFIAPEIMHPVTGRSVAQMLGCCPDKLSVSLYKPVLRPS